MKNREFARNLEIRTKNFALKIIRISSSLSNTLEARVIRNQVSKSGSSIGPTIGKLIEREAVLTLEAKLGFVKVRQARHFIGLK